MTENEKFDLWQYEKLYDLSPKASVVRNIPSGRLMLYHVSSAQNYPVMKDICSIRHPNLMCVYDTVLDGRRCVSLCEFLDGMTLEEAVERFSPYDEAAAKAIMIQVCGALSALHAHGIVHRDVNPSNVMILKNGAVKLIDYDITREEKPGAEKDTHVLGTLGYTSPEQFGFAQTDGRADVYSCGVLLNFLLTGCLPDEKRYEGKLSSVIDQCTQIDREKRYDSAAQLSQILKGNRYTKERRFRPLPGFRGKNPVPKVIMSVLIAFYFLLLAVFISNVIEDGSSGMGDNETWIGTVIHFAILFLCWSFLPYMFFGDMFNLSYRICPKNRYLGRTITKILGAASIVLGFVLIRIV